MICHGVLLVVYDDNFIMAMWLILNFIDEPNPSNG